MLIDQRDLDLLRLIGLCKDIPVDCSPVQCDMFSDTEFSALSGAGYIRKSKCSLSYRLTDKGYTLLRTLGFSVERDKYPVGSSETLRRRLDSAKTVLTLYRMGVKVFGNVYEGKPIYTPAFTFRRKNKGQLLGASQLCGIQRLSKQTVPVYFITNETVLNAKIETAAIEKLSVLLRSPDDRIALFLGDDPSALKQFTSPFAFHDLRSVWGDAFAIQVKWDLYEPPAEPLTVSIYA